MVRTGSCERHRRRIGRWAAPGLLAVLLGAAAPAAAGEFNLLATSSGNLNGGTVGGHSTSQHSFTQTADMNYNRTVTPLFSYRLRFRGSDTESTSSSVSTRTSSSNRFLEPAADVTLAGAKYSLNAGARLRQTYTSGTQTQPLTLTEDNEFLRAFFIPDLLPAFTLQLERTATADDRKPASVDRSVTRAIFGATYTLVQKVNLAYTFTTQSNEDNVARRTQEQRSHVATAGYTDTFFAERLAVNGNYLFSRLDTTERFAPVAAATGGGPVLVPVVLQGAFALAENNPTVAAQSKAPPATYVTLTNNSSIALGISRLLSVNDGGTPNRNESVAVGLAPGATVTTIRLSVSPRAGDPRDISQQAAGVTFQVFAGANPNVNQTAWTAVAITAVTPPTALNPFFEISFTPTGGAFLKLHVAGDTQQPPTGVLPPLTATLVAAFNSAAAAAGPGATTRLTTSNTLQSLSGGITARPIEALIVSANATFSRNERDPSGRRDDNGTYSVTATGVPHRLLTATATYQGSFSTSSDPQTERMATRLLGLTLSSTPLPTLTASVSGTRNESLQEGVLQSRSDAVSFNTALKPYRSLNVDLTTSTSQTRDFTDGTRTQAFSAALNANAILTARLTGLFGLSFGTSQVTGGIAPSSTTSSATFLSLTYTVSRFLNANGRWDFSTSAGNFTLTQQYRLDVIPTLKTSIIVSFLRTDLRTADSPGAQGGPGGAATSGSTNTLSLTARWNISRHLDLSASTNVTRGITGDTTYSMIGTLSFRL